MSAQNRYGYSTPKGVAGGIYDLAPYAIDTFLNEADTGVMKFGVGVVHGTKVGVNANLPAEGVTADKFVGVVTNNHSTEMDMEGKVRILNGAAMGVMRYGRIWVRLAADVKPVHGEPVYLVVKGDEAGHFTNVADGAVAIKGRFLSGVDNFAPIAMVELFNQAQV